MQALSKLFLGRTIPALSDAKLAYFEGDFERCLEICANIRVSSLTSASEIALITARAYLRSGQPREAQNVLAAARDTQTTFDAGLTAQMLAATALIRQDDADAGIRLLLDAAANCAGAHFAIRSEIAFSTALGYWAKREVGVAESYLEFVDPRSDIIHARALELQAWCHAARGDYRRAAAFFRLTLLRLDGCQVSDRAVAATAISTLAIFAAELFDRDIAQFVETRVRRMTWPSGLHAHRYVTLEHQALFHEFSGNTIDAYHLALQAHESASSVPDEVFGWTLRSALARNAGEPYSAMIFAQRGQERLCTLDPLGLTGEERFAMLSVAENCAFFDPVKAGELFAAYCSLAPIDAMVSSSGDPRRTAHETYVAGVIAQAQDKRDHAARCYRKAFEQFRDLGYVRRAILCANALLKLGADDNLLSYIRAELAGITNFITKPFGAPAANEAAHLERHPVVASLPPVQREIVGLICRGKSNKEIARFRNVGEQTVKNMLTKSIFPAFGVSSRAALVSSCLRELWPAANDPTTAAVRSSRGTAFEDTVSIRDWGGCAVGGR